MNYEKNQPAAERAKQKILTDYPYTSYAEFVKNPKNNNFNTSAPEVEKAYADAFDLYVKEKYEESKQLIESSLQKYPKDALVPKFTLLNAFNTGKTAGKEIMILQLEQIALNYAKTPEGIKAKEMLKYLKSDLTIEQTDEQGNAITNVPKPQEIPQATPVSGGPGRPSNDDDIKMEEERIRKLEESASSIAPTATPEQQTRKK